ncbi:MAG: hypothetical protein ACTSWC_07770 [Promethearchaeota archaeon]
METKPESLELTFTSKFKSLHFYLGAIFIIFIAATIVFFIHNPQLRIWALIAGACGLIYVGTEIIKYGQFNLIRFKKSGIFIEKEKSHIPKDVILVEDIDNIELKIRKSRVKVDEGDKQAKSPAFKFWLEIVIVKRLGERTFLDMRKFLSGDEDNILTAAKSIQEFCKTTYHLDAEIIEDTNVSLD